MVCVCNLTKLHNFVDHATAVPKMTWNEIMEHHLVTVSADYDAIWKDVK